MPNGGSDNCGNCPHNVPKVAGTATHEQRRESAFCTVRNVAVHASLWTYCANHYVSEKTPIGPMFGSVVDHERIPYHGGDRPRSCVTSACKICGAPSKEKEGVQITDERAGVLQFCSGRHYVGWWKQEHPGELLKWDCDVEPVTKSVEAVVRDEPIELDFSDEFLLEGVEPEEIQTKLALAEALLELGDSDGVRDILHEVLRDGSSSQQASARALLSRC